MKITKIALKDFRAFYTPDAPIEIDLAHGKNLLVYGENGSGKSSLYLALKLFLESSVQRDLRFDSYRNIYTSANDGFVELRVDRIGDDGRSAGLACQAQWSQSGATPYGTEILRNANKTKGFVDYRALLETHLLRIEGERVNIFSLLVQTLLRDVENSITQRTFFQDWEEVQSAFQASVHNAPAISKINKTIKDFSTGLILKLEELQKQTTQLLKYFEYPLEVRFVFTGLDYRNKPVKELIGQDVILKADLFGKPLNTHHDFLNEAKLSAIAVAILLAAVRLQPSTDLKILAFDDVLIGLDMSNRLPFLQILREQFADHQIFITTYDRAWYEIVKQRTEGENWEYIEFFAGRTDFCELPIYAKDKQYLDRARDYLHKPDNTAPDYKAAAVYVRTHFEYVLKKFCDQHHMPIKYFTNVKDMNTEHFWSVIKKAKTSAGDDVVDATSVSNIEIFRKRVLNPLAHAEEITFHKKEVEDTIQAVQDLHKRLQSLKRAQIVTS